MLSVCWRYENCYKEIVLFFIELSAVKEAVIFLAVAAACSFVFSELPGHKWVFCDYDSNAWQ